MSLVMLTQPPTEIEIEFLHSTLESTDALVVCQSAVILAFRENPFNASGYVRKIELDRLGGSSHSDWTLVDDEKWVELTTTHDKTIVW